MSWKNSSVWELRVVPSKPKRKSCPTFCSRVILFSITSSIGLRGIVVGSKGLKFGIEGCGNIRKVRRRRKVRNGL